jgi:diguanylate cyclase (GGDEF)-like protein/PAS domain S-box-containing protein
MSGRSFTLAIIVAGALAAPLWAARAQKAPSVSAAVLPAPPRTIADAIAQRSADREVTIAGRASVSSGKLQSSAFDVAIEDTTGAIRIFSRNPQSDVHEGDSVVATGAIKSYRGNIELVLSSLHIVDAPRRLIVPRELAINPSILERHSGRLVRVHGRVAGMGRSEGGQWLRLRDASSASHGTVTVWVPANHGSPIDLATVGASDSMTVTGVVTTYQDNADDPIVWQLVPRESADVVISAEPGGFPNWILWTALAIATTIGAVLSISRITARRQLRALRETEGRYRQLLVLLPDAVIVHARGTVLFTNPAAAELLGLPSEEAVVGKPVADFVHPDSRAAFAEVSGDRAMVATDRAPRVRAQILSGNGNVVDVEVASSPCVYHDRPAMVLLARDITAQLRYERDLHALALVDELTGLQNRRAFTLFAEQELARARRHGRTPVLVFADLDGLKQINDKHGHAAGDQAIRMVANALRSIFRETDIVARWSGDEFVAMLVDGSDESALPIRARLDAAIAAQTSPAVPYVVTASVGASPLDPALPLRDAMERADAELYAQKKRGRRSKIRVTPITVDLFE